MKNKKTSKILILLMIVTLLIRPSAVWHMRRVTEMTQLRR